jgi:quercetin dioxygenase-like cupin family protein
MRATTSVSLSPVLAALGLAAVLAQPIAAQYGGMPTTSRQSLPWENSRFKVQYLSVEPGASVPPSGNQVMVYLTADADGRMAPDAILQPPGALQNRGRVRLNAIAVEIKDLTDARPAAGGTPPEALDAEYGVEVAPLVDNPRVLVTKQRYGALAYGGPLHSHAEDVILVYLRGGYTWPADGFWGASRVTRGDVSVIPAHTIHRIGNASTDPLEMLVIVPR